MQQVFQENMIFMIFDTETTGLIDNKIHPSETEKYPYIVQLSYVIIHVHNKEVTIKKIVNNIIRVPDDIIINDIVFNIHGISNEISKKGISIDIALTEFMQDAQQVNYMIAHNAYFDVKVIHAELYRMLKKCPPSNRSSKKIVDYIYYLKYTPNIHCTMMSNVKLCNKKSINKYGNEYTKYPKLVELHQHLFQSIPKHLHNSLNDVFICMRCFLKLHYNIDIFEENQDDKTIKKMKSLLLHS